MQSDFYKALTSYPPYCNIAKKTYREFAGSKPGKSYAVYYEVSDTRDQNLEGVESTGATRIQLDVMAEDASAAKLGCEKAIEAIQASSMTLINASSRSKGHDEKTRLYAHTADLFIHY